MTIPNYRRFAILLQSIENCERSGNKEWETRHGATLAELVKEAMPSGAGFDNGTRLDFSISTSEKLVFHTSFHHMDENGMYDGWTDHKVTVRASLANRLALTVSGSNRNELKDYIAGVFHMCLTAERPD